MIRLAALALWVVLMLAAVWLGFTAGRLRETDEQRVDIDAELEVMVAATPCDCPRCTARRDRAQR